MSCNTEDCPGCPGCDPVAYEVKEEALRLILKENRRLRERERELMADRDAGWRCSLDYRLMLEAYQDAMRKILEKAGSHTVAVHDPPHYENPEDDPGFAGIYAVAKRILTEIPPAPPPVPFEEFLKTLPQERPFRREVFEKLKDHPGRVPDLPYDGDDDL